MKAQRGRFWLNRCQGSQARWRSGVFSWHAPRHVAGVALPAAFQHVPWHGWLTAPGLPSHSQCAFCHRHIPCHRVPYMYTHTRTHTHTYTTTHTHSHTHTHTHTTGPGTGRGAKSLGFIRVGHRRARAGSASNKDKYLLSRRERKREKAREREGERENAGTHGFAFVFLNKTSPASLPNILPCCRVFIKHSVTVKKKKKYCDNIFQNVFACCKTAISHICFFCSWMQRWNQA